MTGPETTPRPAELTGLGGAGPSAGRDVDGPTLTITVHGQPAPQGSKRHVGNGVMVESSRHVKPWRQSVTYAAVEEAAAHPAVPLDEPVVVEITFTVRKPASAPKRRTTWPTRRPDLDKLLRSTLDGLSDAGVWVDDARVVELAARKVYPHEGVDALDTPGALIRIWRLH